MESVEVFSYVGKCRQLLSSLPASLNFSHLKRLHVYSTAISYNLESRVLPSLRTSRQLQSLSLSVSLQTFHVHSSMIDITNLPETQTCATSPFLHKQADADHVNSRRQVLPAVGIRGVQEGSARDLPRLDLCLVLKHLRLPLST